LRRNSLNAPTVVHRPRIQLIAHLVGLRLPGDCTATDAGLPLLRRRGLVDGWVTRQLRVVLFRVVPILPERRFEKVFLEGVVDQKRNTLQNDSSLRGRIQSPRRCVVIRELGLIRRRGIAFLVSCHRLEVRRVHSGNACELQPCLAPGHGLWHQRSLR
jgi:hypothetical protein